MDRSNAASQHRIAGFDQDPLIAAVIAVEVRQDDLTQASYKLATAQRDPSYSLAWAVEYAYRDLSTAYAALWIEADAAGLVNMDALKSSEVDQAEVDRIMAVGNAVEFQHRPGRELATAIEGARA